MPSAPKPKVFVATARFRHGIGGHLYEVGDVVDERRVIDRLVRYGDRFIAPKRTKSPTVDTVTDNPSTKED